MKQKPKFITIIQDCNDDATRGRITTRVQNLFEGVSPSFVSVGAFSDLEAVGNLIDILDAGEGGDGVILVNAAPRHGKGKKYKNGVPFGYFYYKKTLVVLTVDEIILELLKKINIVDKVRVFNIPKVMDLAYKNGLVEKWVAEKTKNTQFRSFEFEPRIARWLWSGIKFPVEEYVIKKEADLGQIYSIDNFGNCKTTLLSNNLKEGGYIKTRIGQLKIYQWLKDLPEGETGLVIGSSGLNQNKFIEIIIQGKSAAKKYNLNIGDNIFSNL